MTKRKISMRLVGLFAASALGLSTVGVRLVWLQALDGGRFDELAATQRVRRVVLSPQRGSIVDRDGAELAISMNMKSIFANPHFVADAKASAAALSPLLQIETGVLEEKLTRKSGFVYLARKVDPEEAAQIKALGLPGVDMVDEPKRFYPSGQLGSHLVGFVGAENEGLGGLEDMHDKLLKGEPGELVMERDPQGRPIPRGKSFIKPPVSGDDLVLTIDKQIQYAAEAALAKGITSYSAKGGTVIVMRPATGEILAMANLPTFDPNAPSATPADSRKNRALIDVYEPGSANKVITAAAALELGVVKPGDVMRVPDNFKLGPKVFHDAHAHPVLNLSFSQVIQQSSNVGTIKVAQGIGKERLHEYLVKFGYGKPTGLNFPGESSGILPKPATWWQTSMGTIPIGQGVAVTPMQIMSVFSTIANDGVAVQPKILSATIDPKGTRRSTPASSRRRVVNATTARQVVEMLVGVTEGKDGTGKMAAVPGYQVGGKTGTAQKPRTDGRGYEGYIGSFIGFAPAGDPQLVVGVILDEPSPIWGGVTAAPVFKEVMQFSLRHLGIGPGPVLPSEGTPLPAPVRSGGVVPSQGAAPDPSRGAPQSDGTAD